MEPSLTVPPELAPLLEELKHLESLFHAACPNASEEMFEMLVADNFWEIGASGRKYSRAFALSVLTSRQLTEQDSWKTSDYHLSQVGETVYLLTYMLHQPNRITRRLTVWERTDNYWKAVYHQGTVVQS